MVPNFGPGTRVRLGEAARAARMEAEVAEDLIRRGLVERVFHLGRHEVLVDPAELTKAFFRDGVFRRPRLTPEEIIGRARA